MGLVVSLYGGGKLVLQSFAGVGTEMEYDEPSVLGAELCGGSLHDFVRESAQECVDDPEDSKKGFVGLYNRHEVEKFMEEEKFSFEYLLEEVALLQGGVSVVFDGTTYVLCQSFECFNGDFVGRGYDASKRDLIKTSFYKRLDKLCSKNAFFDTFFDYWT
jgi:hypothetical protein